MYSIHVETSSNIEQCAKNPCKIFGINTQHRNPFQKKMVQVRVAESTNETLDVSLGICLVTDDIAKGKKGTQQCHDQA